MRLEFLATAYNSYRAYRGDICACAYCFRELRQAGSVFCSRCRMSCCRDCSNETGMFCVDCTDDSSDSLLEGHYGSQQAVGRVLRVGAVPITFTITPTPPRGS
jgi:hypothetical protein